MTAQDNVTRSGRITAATLLGLLGITAFSLSLPSTRFAVDGLSPWFVAFGRAVGAGVLAAAYLAAVRAPRPTPAQWRRLAIVAFGVVIGFPLCTSIALTQATAAHGAIVIALLPAVTAVFGVLRGGERPSPRFWLSAGAGLAAVLVFIAVSGGAQGGFRSADLWFLAAVLVCGLAYAEGGVLARELGGARTICWALILSLPVTVPLSLVATDGLATAPAHAWWGFAYVTVISMFLGFFAWYAALARGGVARVAQVQALQPVLTLVWSAVLLDEHVDPLSVGVGLVVLACVVATQRTR
ncbi:DMT family transporter [Saccharothrix violaceirubra]|uniref:Drug/metabolite transporter (DMT)-like permease n=1 Tax=Saccharothrix violaceirubra TaxID=413306 RepID=A0A7W7T1Y4_9PSEU|nr:DMT family transporter [Saccharothrix violaceirubra]MBB4965080.1 drug/metabolite transporter (DMT)-like permease [Saccharothrix violaceirubra]